MPGKKDGSSWEDAFEMKTYEDFIDFLERKQSSTGFTNQYYVLMNDIDCKKYIYKDKEIAIVATTKQYLNGNGYSIKNFFMNNSRIARGLGGNYNGTQYYFENIILDSWIIKDSVFGQQILSSSTKIVNPHIQISNSKISMCMIGSNKTDVGAGTTDYDYNDWFIRYHEKNCGSSIGFVSSSINLKYYPEKYWFEHPNENLSLYKNMLRMLTFDNSKAKIYLPFSLNTKDYYKTNSDGSYSSRNYCYNARYGMNIRNYSDIELIVDNFLIESRSINDSKGNNRMIMNYNLAYFNEVKDSIIKIYPKSFVVWDFNGGFVYYDCIPVTAIHINLATESLTSGKNLLYIDLKNITGLNGKLPQGIEFESTEQSATTVYTSEEENIKNAEWLLNNGIVCIDSDLNSTTGD